MTLSEAISDIRSNPIDGRKYPRVISVEYATWDWRKAAKDHHQTMLVKMADELSAQGYVQVGKQFRLDGISITPTSNSGGWAIYHVASSAALDGDDPTRYTQMDHDLSAGR